MGIIYQKGLFGGEVVAGDVVDRVRFVLESYPETRDSYAALMAAFWMEFDGLDEVLPADVHDDFVCWFVSRATSAKTLQNRAMEVQRGDARLGPSEGVREKRRRQAVQGRVR